MPQVIAMTYLRKPICDIVFCVMSFLNSEFLVSNSLNCVPHTITF